MQCDRCHIHSEYEAQLYGFGLGYEDFDGLVENDQTDHPKPWSNKLLHLFNRWLP